MSDRLNLYHQLPYPLKFIAASLRGYYLHWWRYGHDTEILVQQTLERDKWSEEQWKIYRETRLELLLHRAMTRVPFYRDYWHERRRHGDKSSWQELTNWPILAKRDVRENSRRFIADDCNISNLFEDHTGGTTGTPLKIYQSRKTVQHWHAIYEARIRRWHGVNHNDHWAIFGGQMVTPLYRSKPPFWVENMGLNQLYLSTFHISSKNVKEYAKKINQFKPTHLVVYPSSAVEFAREVLTQNIELWQPKVVFSNAEAISTQQRVILSKAFQCKVISTYGMGEIVFGASECENIKMHEWPETGILEVLDDNLQTVKKGATGSFYITGLINQDMPLVRYAIGDCGHLGKNENCSCGRSLPVMQSIEGRISEMIQTLDGKKIFWLNPVFYDLNIVQGQIIQETLDRIRVNVIPSEGFGPSDFYQIKHRLQQRVGQEININITPVDSLERGENGKVQQVISRIS